jgi:hypothetical protein
MLAALELRLAALEREMAEVRRWLSAATEETSGAQDVFSEIPMIRKARAQQAAANPVLDRLYGELMAQIRPVSIEELQAMQEPYDPSRGWNMASEEIVEMREE